MRGGPGPLTHDVFLYRTALPGARLRARFRGAHMHDARGTRLASVVETAPGRWFARVLGAAVFTGATVALMAVGSAWVLAVAVPPMLLASLVLTLLLTPEPRYALLSETGETWLSVRPASRWGAWRTSRIEDGEGQRLGRVLRAPLRDRFWPLGHTSPLMVVQPEEGAPIEVQRPAALSPGWVFSCEGRPVARYAIGTLPGKRDRLEIGDTVADRRLLLAAVMIARP